MKAKLLKKIRQDYRIVTLHSEFYLQCISGEPEVVYWRTIVQSKNLKTCLKHLHKIMLRELINLGYFKKQIL